MEIEIVDGLIEYDSNSDHYIPMEELRPNKDERFAAMVEGRWDEFGADLPRCSVPESTRRLPRSSSDSRASASSRSVTAA